MRTLRLTVQGGKLVGDAPRSLPEGAVVSVVLPEEGDEFSAEELAALNDAIDESWEQFEAGEEVSADDAMAQIAAIQ